VSEAPEEEAYRGKLNAQTTRWRLGLGVGSWGLAVAWLAMLGVVLGGTSTYSREITRLTAYSLPMIGTFAVAGYLLLRVGELDPSTGRIVRAAPIPWSRIVGLVLALAIVLALVIAWPLGVYTSIAASRSTCGALVPIDALRGRTPSRLSYHSVSEQHGECDVIIAAEGWSQAAVSLRTRPVADDHEWAAQLRRFHPDRRDAISDEVLLLENDSAFVIAVRREGFGRFVQLRRGVFDREDALALAGTI